MAGRNPISSVYGDTGSVEATYTKDLNTLGNDPYVRVTANSGEFNLFQQMNLTDNFYDSRFEEVYVTQNSAGAANALSLASLQFNTMGWSRVDRMYLQIPVVINYIASNCWHGFEADVDPLRWHEYDYADPTLNWIMQTAYTLPNATDFVSSMTQLDFALMEIFNRIQVYGGNNNQPIGRTQSFFKEGLKTQLREVPWNENTAKILGRWGLPQANLNAVNSNTSSVNNNIISLGSFSPMTTKNSSYNLNANNIPDNWASTWAETLFACDPTNQGGVFNTVPATNRAVFNQTRLNLVLPLAYINNFFRHKTYLPPDFKLKIDIEGVPQPLNGEINFNCPLIAVGNLNQYNPRMMLNDTHFADCYGFSAGIDFSNIKCVYQNHTLRQPIQAQINEKWLAYPIVYNYETFEQYDVDNSAQGTSTMIVRDIAISQQRPTQLIFQIIDTVTQCPDIRGNFTATPNGEQTWPGTEATTPVRLPYQFTATNNPAVGTAQTHGTATKGSTPWFTDIALNGTVRQPLTVSGALSNKGTPSGYINVNTDTQRTENLYPIITTISTLIGGRTQYYYKNDSDVNVVRGNIPMNAYDVLIAEQDAECYKDYSTETNVLKFPLQYSSLGGTGVYQRITIAPGGYVNTADIPTDLGATVIRVQVTLSNTLPSTKKLQIVKKMPEQIAVDTNKNCTLIMWPAIKSNNGFAIPNVVNTQ